jgi:hypothetical protein
MKKLPFSTPISEVIYILRLRARIEIQENARLSRKKSFLRMLSAVSINYSKKHFFRRQNFRAKTEDLGCQTLRERKVTSVLKINTLAKIAENCNHCIDAV